MNAHKTNKHALVTGAAGFIGSHLVERLLRLGYSVTGVDSLLHGAPTNFTRGAEQLGFRFIQADVADAGEINACIGAVRPDIVWHLAANSNIARGMAEPALDLRNTFLSTYHVLEAMRRQYVRRFVFTSSSAVYGRSEGGLTEDTGPLLPISNYGAMKLASEALISSAAEMFLANAIILRLPNVVGPRASHGLIFDLFSKLREAPPYLEVLGDGRQQKQYLHITELVDAMTFISGRCNEGLHLLNIGPDDDGITVQQIAEMLLKNAGTGIPVRYTGGEQGWPGDVPRFRYSVRKLAKLGWSARMGSVEAVQRAIVENLSMGAGRK